MIELEEHNASIVKYPFVYLLMDTLHQKIFDVWLFLDISKISRAFYGPALKISSIGLLSSEITNLEERDLPFSTLDVCTCHL